MNINQLLFLTFILLFYIQYSTSETYESFEGEVTPGSCIQRMLDYECIDLEKRDQFNIDCENFEIAIPSGIVNIHCDNKVLFDTLLCEKMITEGACECIYGRRQVQGLCNVPPLNISCPMELQSRDLAIINKMNTICICGTSAHKINKQINVELFNEILKKGTVLLNVYNEQ